MTTQLNFGRRIVAYVTGLYNIMTLYPLPNNRPDRSLTAYRSRFWDIFYIRKCTCADSALRADIADRTDWYCAQVLVALCMRVNIVAQRLGCRKEELRPAAFDYSHNLNCWAVKYYKRVLTWFINNRTRQMCCQCIIESQAFTVNVLQDIVSAGIISCGDAF